jgi:hypothetical protein
MTLRLKNLLPVLACAVTLFTLPAAAQRPPGVAPAGRQAVLSGQITDVGNDSLTINYFGREMNVDARALLGQNGNLDDFYEEGMMVTVRGTLTDEDRMAATSITEISNLGPGFYGTPQ